MICPNCSNVILDGSAFCGFCGHALPQAAPEAAPEVVAPVVTAPIEPAPVTDAPKIPVVETPVVETPIVEVPVMETPVAEIPTVQAPSVEPASAPVEIPAAPVTMEAPIPVAPAEPAAIPDKHIGAWGYFFTDIVLCIPLLGLIMFFVWACSSTTNKQRKSYVRSKFIWFVVCFILSILVGVFCTLCWSNVAPILQSIANYWANVLKSYAATL